jgi:hypothetical protein
MVVYGRQKLPWGVRVDGEKRVATVSRFYFLGDDEFERVDKSFDFAGNLPNLYAAYERAAFLNELEKE